MMTCGSFRLTINKHQKTYITLMNKDNTYNGWTNYATWRVNLEIFDGGEFSNMAACEMREFVEELIEDQTPEGLARDYAMAFLADVDWMEIREHYEQVKEVA